ncbi:MAG: response regulator [Elusimicrobiota bacterium]|jgi:CheY-like chemotaxis protein
MPPKTILIVDDDPFILDILSRHLKGKGFRILSTTDPETAYVLAEKEHPDLIISDIAMPAIDGFTLLKELRDNSNTSQIPVVLLTASDKMADVEQGFASGAQAYLLKPIEWDTAWPKLAPLLGT